MAQYRELLVSELLLDLKNPRIARLLEFYEPDQLTPEAIALALGSSESTYEGLKESIRANGGVINPIVVNQTAEHQYVVIEGNTRVQIYRKLKSDGVPGSWDSIPAIVYTDVSDEVVHSIRLQVHLVGPREWDPYSKAKYLYELMYIAKLPMSTIISYCGGNSKSSEVQNMIAAYIDMEKYYRPLCNDDAVFNHKNFSGYLELQRKSISESIVLHGLTKTDFSKWIVGGYFDRLQDIRRIPDILNNAEARKTFFRERSSDAAIKVLAIADFTSDNLKDVPYETLATELAKRMRNIAFSEILHLKSDTQYETRRDALQSANDEIAFVLEQVQGE